MVEQEGAREDSTTEIQQTYEHTHAIHVTNNVTFTRPQRCHVMLTTTLTSDVLTYFVHFMHLLCVI